ncbi:hypothetical protein D9M71_202860 [compost metagenome]
MTKGSHSQLERVWCTRGNAQLCSTQESQRMGAVLAATVGHHYPVAPQVFNATGSNDQALHQ